MEQSHLGVGGRCEERERMRGMAARLSRRSLHVAFLALLVFVVVGGAAQSSTPAQAIIAPELVTNGGFEARSVVNASSFDTYPAGSPNLTGWTIDNGSIDHIKGYWGAKEGSQSIDLDGGVPGAISQTLTTVPGQSYVISFAYSTNYDRQRAGTACSNLTVRNASMDVRWGGASPSR